MAHIGYNKKHETEKTKLLKKINELQKKYNVIKNDLRVESFPNGALVYVIDYSTIDEHIYRIGITTNMKYRKKIYDTHTLHKHRIVLTKEFKSPKRLEDCLRSLLYDHRYKNKKDFYICELRTIRLAINKCLRDFGTIDHQKGGSKSVKQNRPKYISYFRNEIKSTESEINKLQKKIDRLFVYL